LVAGSLHPEYNEVLDTYLKHLEAPRSQVQYDAERGQLDLSDLDAQLDDQTAALIVQSPNFFGIVEQIDEIAERVHRHGALLIVMFTESVALGIVKPPAAADIVAGEMQSFAHPPSFGGPSCGVLAAKSKF